MYKSDLVDQRMKTNNTIWDDYYRTYQRDSDMPGVKYPNEHLVRFINAISKEDEDKDKKILELGFGTVANMLMMREYGYQVLGLEVSADAVRRAENFIKTNGLDKALKVGIFGGNILPVEDQSFDAIVGLQCVYYNIDQEHFAKECHRVLKPGGRIFFSFFTPRHGYMNYIEGEPGSVVRFNEDHPNPRLKGLELFLFRSREQFEDIYGKYFDIEIGLDESDLYSIFMSWCYLIGEKMPVKKPRRRFVIEPFKRSAPEAKEACEIDLNILRDNNIELWNKKYNSIYKDELVPGNRYPNEYLVRFLATRERRSSNRFYHNIGREDEIKGRGDEKVLELSPLNITNLSMVTDLNYIAHGLSSSDIVVERGMKAIRALNRENKIYMDKLDNIRFPYRDEEFHFIISEKMGSYFMDQKKFIEEMAKVIRKDGEIFIGYLSPRHEYMRWAVPLGGGYYKITHEHPDQTMHGMVIYIVDDKVLRADWDKFFDTEIKHAEYDLYRYFSSFNFVKAKKRV